MNLSIFANFTPSAVLDIGCNIGQFYRECKSFWPHGVEFVLIDGNENVEDDLIKLNVEYYIAVLSDTVKDVTWYSTKENLKCTGDSYYRENTKHYTDDKVIKIVKETKTLNDMFPDRQFDLIKLDTQGSEIDILKGGAILCRKAKYIILETSLIEYNLNSPNQETVNDFMKSIGFKPISVLDYHFLGGKLIQEDILYENCISQ